MLSWLQSNPCSVHIHFLTANLYVLAHVWNHFPWSAMPSQNSWCLATKILAVSEIFQTRTCSGRTLWNNNGAWPVKTTQTSADIQTKKKDSSRSKLECHVKIFDQLCCQILNVHMGERQNFVNPQNPDLDMQFTSDKNFVCSEPVPKTCCSWNIANYFRTLLPIGPPSHSSSYKQNLVFERTGFVFFLKNWCFPRANF